MAMDLNAKAAYIRGLMTGMDFDADSKNGKVIAAMMDLLEEMAAQVTEHDNALDQVYDELETLDQDLDDVVSDIYADEDEDDEEDAEDDSTMYEVTCPNCGQISTLDEERDGQDVYQALDMAVYARKTFGMFTGEEINVQLRFENHLVGAVLDRLGRDILLIPDGEDHFTVRTQVIVSPQFFAWICGFGTAVKVLGPDHVVQQIAEYVKSIANQYE